MNNIDISQQVMDRICLENIKMRPRMHFIFKAAFLKLSIALFLILSVFLCSLVLFKLRLYNPFGFLTFGFLGLGTSLKLIPWDIITLALAVISIGIRLLIYLDFSYQKNFSSLAVGLLLFTIFTGATIDQTGLNEQLKKANQLPWLYRGRYFSNSWVIGEITKSDYQKHQLVVTVPVLTKPGENLEILVTWDNRTFFPTGKSFPTGVYVQVVGEDFGSFFKAQGVAVYQNYPADFHRLIN